MKSFYKFLMNALSTIILPLMLLSDRFAEKAGVGCLMKDADATRLSVLRAFVSECLIHASEVHACYNAVDESTSTEERQRLYHDLDQATDQRWNRIKKFQSVMKDLGINLNMLEVFGRVSASLRVNHYKRAVAHLIEINGKRDANTNLIDRFSQATARLSVIQIALEDQREVSKAFVDAALSGSPSYPGDGPDASDRTPEENERRTDEIIMAESARASALDAVQMILKQPIDEVRARLQDFYDRHPERRGTLVFTSAAPPVRLVTPKAAETTNVAMSTESAAEVPSCDSNKVTS